MDICGENNSAKSCNCCEENKVIPHDILVSVKEIQSTIGEKGEAIDQGATPNKN